MINKKITETHVWHWLKEAAKKDSLGDHKESGLKLTRIETSTVNGVPDICYYTHQEVGFIELKIYNGATDKVFHPDLIGLTVKQADWFATCPNSWVMVYVVKTGDFIVFKRDHVYSGSPLLCKIEDVAQYTYLGHASVSEALGAILYY